MLTKSQDYNPNYLAKIVKLQKPIEHPNADKLLGWIIDGNKVWTDNINYKEEDTVIYFPLECQINPLILSQLNLYSNSDMNHDKTQKGFFDKNGRVRAIRLRGEPSEGFILKLESFEKILLNNYFGINPINIGFIQNQEFDMIGDSWICKKYIPKIQGKIVQKKLPKKFKSILQHCDFKFHYDTENLRKNIDKFSPNDLITITKKYHGTSGISANLLTEVRENKFVKWIRNSCTIENYLTFPWFLCLVIANEVGGALYGWLVWGIYIPHLIIKIFNKKYRNFITTKLSDSNRKEYIHMSSSRKVIKAINEVSVNKGGYYNFDIWKHCHNILKYSLEPGITLYYEIVGYLPNGNMIQKGYDYGCTKPTSSEFDAYGNLRYYQEGKEFKLLIYRITYTTLEGKVIEFSWEQIKNYCRKYNLGIPTTYFQGSVKEYVGESHTGEPDMAILLERLQYEFLEKIDDECNNKVPDEGVVIRIENGRPEAYKLKSFAFLERESKQLDLGEVDIETEQAI